MNAEPNIGRIKSALEMYRWNKADVFKQDQNGESFGAFGMLLRDIGVTTEDFSKCPVPQLVTQNMDKLVSVYGLRDVVDLELITVANDCSKSQQEMVSKVTEYLSGNYSSLEFGLRHWLLSLVEQRSQFPMATMKNPHANKYISPEKFRDVRWQKKRIEILERDGERCQGIDENGVQCKKTLKDEQLEIHHRNYTTPDPWDEPSENLISLCRECHEKEKNANLGQAARDVCNALMKSNWMVWHRKLLVKCISEKIVSPEELCNFISKRMK